MVRLSVILVLLSSLGSGQVQLTGHSSCTGNCSLGSTTAQGGGYLQSISVSPSAITVSYNATQQFLIVENFSNGTYSTLPAGTGTLSSSNTALAINNGNGVFQCVSTAGGSVTVNASYNGFNATAALTCKQSPITVSGLLALPPAQPLGSNQVTDPGFESGGANWSLPTCFTIDATTAHSGLKSLRYTPGTGCRVAYTTVNRGPGSARAYTLQGWVRATAGSNIQLRLGLHDVNDAGASVTGTGWVTPTSTWQFIQVRDIDLLPVHDGHTLKITVDTAGGNTGTAWVDDVQLIEQLPLPVSSFLLYPNFRGYLWSDGPQTIRLQTEVAQPAGRNVEATLQVDGGATITTVSQSAQATQELDFDASQLGLGTYLINTALTDSSGNVLATFPTYRIVKVNPQFRNQLVSYIDVDNFLVHKGQKHFVWGVYDRFSSLRCQGCLYRSVASYLGIKGFAGLGTVDNYSDTLSNTEMNIIPFSGVNPLPPSDFLTPWLQALDSRGVAHLQIVNAWVQGNKNRPYWAATMGDSQLWQLIAKRMQGQPGALGFYTYDEPDSSQIPTVFAQGVVLRENDPGSINFGTLVNSRSIFRWRDMSDVLSCDPYPVAAVPGLDDIPYGATSGPPMLRTSIWTRQTERQVYNSRPVWMVLQLFRTGGVFPNYNQMKTQAYKAIINGANGILWWGFVSAVGEEAQWYIFNNPQSYYDFKRISQEVMGLEPILISPPQPQLVSGISNSSIEWMAKSDGHNIFLFASSMSENPVSNVTFTLSPPSGAALGAQVQVYSESRTLPVAGGQSFTDSFVPYEAHVYVIPLRCRCSTACSSNPACASMWTKLFARWREPLRW